MYAILGILILIIVAIEEHKGRTMFSNLRKEESDDFIIFLLDD